MNDYSELIGQIITHKKYGDGNIVSLEKEYVVCDFDNGQMRASYLSFGKLISVNDNSVRLMFDRLSIMYKNNNQQFIKVIEEVKGGKTPEMSKETETTGSPVLPNKIWSVQHRSTYSFLHRNDHTLDIDEAKNGVYKVWSSMVMENLTLAHISKKKGERRPFVYSANKVQLLAHIPDLSLEILDQFDIECMPESDIRYFSDKANYEYKPLCTAKDTYKPRTIITEGDKYCYLIKWKEDVEEYIVYSDKQIPRLDLVELAQDRKDNEYKFSRKIDDIELIKSVLGPKAIPPKLGQEDSLASEIEHIKNLIENNLKSTSTEMVASRRMSVKRPDENQMPTRFCNVYFKEEGGFCLIVRSELYFKTVLNVEPKLTYDDRQMDGKDYHRYYIDINDEDTLIGCINAISTLPLDMRIL